MADQYSNQQQQQHVEPSNDPLSLQDDVFANLDFDPSEADLGDDELTFTDEPIEHIPAQQQEFNVNSQQQQQQQRDQQTLTQQDQQQGQLRDDGRGNLVDQNGQVVASAGAHRRHYDELQTSRAQLNFAQQEISQVRNQLSRATEIAQQYQQNYQNLQQSVGYIRDSGLNEQEIRQALHYGTIMRNDPISGVKQILTQLASNGIDISSLGVQGGGFDVQGLVQQFRNELQPLQQHVQQQQAQQQQQQDQQQQQQARQDEANRQVSEFFRLNPKAAPYAEHIDRMLGDPRFQHMTLNEAWLNIQLYLAQNPQGQQRESNQNLRTPQSRPNGPTPPAPPAGRGAIASTDESYDSIINDILNAEQVR